MANAKVIEKKKNPKSQSNAIKGKSSAVKPKATASKTQAAAPKVAKRKSNLVPEVTITGPVLYWGGGKATSLEGKFENVVGLPNIVDSAMKGVSVEVFYNFANTIDIPDKYLAAILNTTARTLSNYKDQNKPLEPVKGEHLLKLIALFKKGEEVFGTLSEFHSWLSKTKMGSQKVPLELLITPGGVELISLELDRIAWGYAI